MLTFSGGQDNIINENTLNEHEGCRREGTRSFSRVKWRQLIFMSLAGAYNFNKGSIPYMYEWRVRHIPAVRRSWKVVLKWRRLQRLQYKAIGGQEDERHVWYFPMKVCDYMIWGYSSNKIWSLCDDDRCIRTHYFTASLHELEVQGCILHAWARMMMCVAESGVLSDHLIVSKVIGNALHVQHL